MITLSTLASLLICAQVAQEHKENLPPSITAITPEVIQEGVDYLSDDSLYGRYWLSPFAQQAAEWIRDQLQEAGVEPGAADGSWFQSTNTKANNHSIGRNQY